ncbi:YciI family protein [Mycolicibacterium sp. CBMA 234]|uniref:YciI family protein n=1 Tax=Mycolicibacterium sp. CBMA 234 TaxID=1918495 RepID=UPI001391D342|nr:YciI family protein [Mycolicibacterium sp. CBMA 234]
MTPEWLPRYLLVYSSTEQARTKVPELFPAHQEYADRYRLERPGVLLMLGPVPDAAPGEFGALAVFTDQAAAEQFAVADPFVVGGAVTEWTVKTWLWSVEPTGEGDGQ